MVTVQAFSERHPSPSSWHIPSSTDIHRSQQSQGRGGASGHLPARQARAVLDFIKVHADTGTVEFNVPQDSSAHATTIRSRDPVPSDCPVYMFEVKIVGIPEGPPLASRVAVGVQYTDTLLTKLPGLERSSLAMHSGSGMLHTSMNTPARQYGTFSSGDVVGVLVNRVDDSVSFAKNGIWLGVALQGLPSRAMYASLGFDGGRASVQTNFGDRQPFWHAEVLEAARQKAHDLVQAQAVRDAGDIGGAATGLLMDAVMSHLEQACCWRTMQALRQAAAKQGGSDLQLGGVATGVESMQQREEVGQLLRSGNIARARQLLEAALPNLSASHPVLHFELNLQNFVELVRGTVGLDAQLSAMRFARGHLQASAAPSVEASDRLADALTLLAYEQPSSSPMAHLFKQELRERCVVAANAAMMQQRGVVNGSRLQELCQQAAAVHGELSRRDCVEARLLPLTNLYASEPL